MKKIIREGKRVRVATHNTEPSMTQQHHKDACDVNNIIAKYKTTGEITHLARTKGIFADVSDITDYHESLNKIQSASLAFQALSSDIRLRFGNDPAQLLAFMQDPKNYDEGVKLGIYEPKQNSSKPADTIKNDLNESKNMKPKKEEQLNLESKSEK